MGPDHRRAPPPSGRSGYRFEEEDRYAPPGVPSIEVRSDYEGTARAVEMVVQPVRVLDPSNQPMIVVQALSAPRLRLDGRSRADYVSPLRDTEHTLILRNRKMEEAGRVTQRAPASVGGISVFRLRHPPQPIHLTVYGNVVGSPVIDADTLTLAGQGHAYIDEPLVRDPSIFEVSDLAVGTRVDVEALGQALPFPLLPSTRIWTGDALRVYLELYHLTADAGGTARYDLRFRLLPLDDLGDVKSSPSTLVSLGSKSDSTDSNWTRPMSSRAPRAHERPRSRSSARHYRRTPVRISSEMSLKTRSKASSASSGIGAGRQPGEVPPATS